MSRTQSELFPWEESEAGSPTEAREETAPDDAGEGSATPPADQPEPGSTITDTRTGEDDPPGDVADATETPETAEREGERSAGDEDGLAGLEPYLERVPGRERLIAPKEYYSISEVCEIVGLKPHVLRYWETQFPVLNPSKNRSGNRVYQRKEIRLVLLVKHLLYDEKYTVEGAKQRIEQMRKGGDLREAAAEAMSEEALALLKDDLRQLLRILKPPVDG